MNITPIRHNAIYVNKNNKSFNEKIRQNNYCTQISCQQDISFEGLKFLQDVKPVADAKILTGDLDMSPKKAYSILRDAVFVLGAGSILNLANSEIKEMIDKLEIGESIIFGKNKTIYDGIDEDVSKKHLKIRKKSNEELIAMDLNSSNGTTIRQNTQVLTKENEGESLNLNQKYLLPRDVVLKIGNTDIFMARFFDEIKNLKPGEKFYFGKMQNNGISINPKDESKRLVSIENSGQEMVVSILNSDIETKIEKFHEELNVNDYSNTQQIQTLKKRCASFVFKRLTHSLQW